jgi:glycosyltransferase 2 family protein
MVIGPAVFAICARAARAKPVSDNEIAAFEAINGLPEAFFRPTWVVMQTGSLAGVFAAAGLAAFGRRPATAIRLASIGTAVWAGAKVTKHFVKRGRPAATLASCRELGRPQSGLGYPSGHAAVAATLATIITPLLPPRWRAVAWVVAVSTGVSRIYVGAHLPLDVVGGFAGGMAAGSAARRLNVRESWTSRSRTLRR